MSFSYNNLPGEVKCDCSRPYRCQVHLGKHLVAMKSHRYEILTEIESERLKLISLKTLKKLEQINIVKNDLMLKTKTLINSIEIMFKQSLSKLDALINSYLGIMNKKNFDLSDMEFIRKIEEMDLNVNSLNIDGIQNQIETAYAQEFASYVEDMRDGRVRFLDEHVGGFWCGVIMKDGKTLVTGGSDSVIRVWDLVQKSQLFTLHGHNSDVKCLALTSDFQHIISGSYDASVRIWNFQQKAQVGIFKGHNTRVYAVCYLERQQSIASGDFDGELIIWDFSKLTIINKINYSGGVCSLILTKNQFNLIAGSNPNIKFYEFGFENTVSDMKGHSGSVLSLKFTSNEEKIISGSSDNSIIIWDLKYQNIIKKLKGHSGAVNSLAITSDDKLIVSGSSDKTVRMWNIKTGMQTNVFSHKSFFYCIVRVGKKIITLSEDSGIGELDVECGEFQISWFLKPFKSDSISFTSDSKLVAYGSKNEAAIWDMDTKLEKNTLVEHNQAVQYVGISRDGRFAISCSGGRSKNLIYWNLETNEKVAELSGHTTTVFCACFSKDGSTAASGSGDKTVRTWNLSVTRQKKEFQGHAGSVYSIKFLDDNKFLVSAGEDTKVIIWSLINATQHAVLNGHRGSIYKILVTDDEKFIISCNLWERIRIWNVNRLQQEFAFSDQKRQKAGLTRIELI